MMLIVIMMMNETGYRKTLKLDIVIAHRRLFRVAFNVYTAILAKQYNHRRVYHVAVSYTHLTLPTKRIV